jgi:hypothetical protein
MSCRRPPADPVRGATGSIAPYHCHDGFSVAMRAAERVYAFVREQNNPALLIGGCVAMAVNLYFLGDLEAGQQYARRGVQIWRSRAVQFAIEEVDVPVVSCLFMTR